MDKIQVFKFGGASIATTEAMRNVEQIISQHATKPLVVVVSAMGKTTNALEEIANGYFNNKNKANELTKSIKEAHFLACDELLQNPQVAKDQINNFFVEIDWLLEDDVESNFSYVYDQIVSIGELSSTTILAEYLKEKGQDAVWLDAREIIKTDGYYQQANIQWDKTKSAVKKELTSLLSNHKVVITQGFIGSTDDNNTTTLGREGSDFTGAIIANCMQADSLSIWKDVPGVLNADPRWLTDTVKLKEMNYREAVEQTYYGAKVIHPKTIKPLQNEGIPLHVRSFIKPTEEGTTVAKDAKNEFDKPIYVLKKNQIMLHCITKDFSFFDYQDINRVMKVFEQEQCNINLLQSGAVQCSFVFDFDQEMIDVIQNQLAEDFTITIHDNLELLTIRHYDNDAVNSMTADKQIILEQRTPINYQALYSL